MTTTTPITWDRRTTRRELLRIGQLVAEGTPHAAATARSVVPLLAADICPDALGLFFKRLVPALRDGRVGSADLALEALLGGDVL